MAEPLRNDLPAVPSEEAWYALHVKSRHEVRVEERLTRLGVEAFLPRNRVSSRRRDRKVILETPLFPGYVFARACPEGPRHGLYLAVLQTPGVVRALSYQGRPAPVPEAEIDSLRILCAARLALAHAPFRPGEKVTLTTGPLAGLSGRVRRVRAGRRRVTVDIMLLRRGVAVEVDEEFLERPKGA